MPLARNLSNIHFSCFPGSPGNVGAYQTQGIRSSGARFSGRIRNAVRPATANTSPGTGNFFFGACLRSPAVPARSSASTGPAAMVAATNAARQAFRVSPVMSSSSFTSPGFERVAHERSVTGVDLTASPVLISLVYTEETSFLTWAGERRIRGHRSSLAARRSMRAAKAAPSRRSVSEILSGVSAAM